MCTGSAVTSATPARVPPPPHPQTSIPERMREAMASRALSTATAVRVVGIGASAGGLDAFIDLVSALPVDTGFAFVLIQHLDPHHDSMLVDILAGATPNPVLEVVDGMQVEGNRVYVIPPDAEMTIQGDVLRLVPRTAKVPHRPLDSFFCSLAQDR